MTEKLAQLGRELPEYQPTEQRREAIRTALLLEAAATPPGVAPRRRRWVAATAVAAVAAAAAIAFVVLSAGRDDGARVVAQEPDVPAPAAPRATVQSPAGAQFVHEPPFVGADGTREELVKLGDGRVTVRVDSLARRERFRVVTGDAEVESRGATFDVEVAGEALGEVAVHTGRVEVRVSGQRTVVLGAGETWKPEVVTGELELGRDAPREPAVTSPKTRAEPAAPSRRTVTVKEKAVAPAPIDVAPEPATPADDAVEVAFQGGWKAMRGGRFGAAARGFAKALALDPDHAMAEDARYWRAVALARSGKTKSAARAMREFLAHHRASARAGEVSVMLGWILLEGGDHAAAAPLFRAGQNDKSAKVRESARAGLARLEP